MQSLRLFMAMNNYNRFVAELRLMQSVEPQWLSNTIVDYLLEDREEDQEWPYTELS